MLQLFLFLCNAETYEYVQLQNNFENFRRII